MPFARNRARLRCIRTLAANWSCGGKSPPILPSRAASSVHPPRSSSPAASAAASDWRSACSASRGRKVWMEDPGFPFTRRGLELARLSLAPIPVDADGIDVDHGLRHAPGCGAGCRHPRTAGAARTHPVAGTAFTPARLGRSGRGLGDRGRLSGRAATEGPRRAGACLARSRRSRHSHRLLQQDPEPRPCGWAFSLLPRRWRRSLPRSRRVSRRRPGRRCSSRPRSSCATATICAISGARSGSMQRNATRLLKYLRPHADDITIAGLAVLLRLPDGAPDRAIARETLSFGLAPAPLSLWYASTGFSAIGSAAGYRDISTQASRGILRPPLMRLSTAFHDEPGGGDRNATAFCSPAKSPDGQIIQNSVHPFAQKYSAFAVGQIKTTIRRHPAPTRGALRDRHGRWVGERWTRSACARRDAVLTRTAKSCGPDAAVLASSLAIVTLRVTVARKPFTGESTK